MNEDYLKFLLRGFLCGGPRSEMAIIMALIGQGMYAAIMLASLVTTIITPIVYRNWFYKDEVRPGSG